MRVHDDDVLFFSTLASLLKSRNAVMRNDVFTDVLKLYFNRGKKNCTPS